VLSTFDPKQIDEKVQEEIDFFLKDEPDLRVDVEYVFKIGVPDRPKAYLMLIFADALGIDKDRILPFVIVADLMMAAAMNDDDIIDANDERCGYPVLWKKRGLYSTIMVTGYMYGLIFSILKRHRPQKDHPDFHAYQRSENLLMDYFRIMHIGQYRTTTTRQSLATFSLQDLETLAAQKASLLFQFCCVVPAYFVGQHIDEVENFGYQLGIVRQYISDIQDFMEVAGDNYKNGARMEDYFTHQPNLVLLLTGISNELSTEEKEWFYTMWAQDVLDTEKEVITQKVMGLVAKANAVALGREELKRIKSNLEAYLSVLPDQELKATISKWAFRFFPLD
jgi:geranylgeranyl pyrophosphate synthase